MVQLFALSILQRPMDGTTPDGNCTLIKGSYDLSSFGLFKAAYVKEFISIASLKIVEKTEPGIRQSVKEQVYVCHVYVREDGLAAVLISDVEYPGGVAHKLLTKVLNDFASQFEWELIDLKAIDLDIYKDLDFLEVMDQYQNPMEPEVAAELEAEADVDETTIIVHNTVNAFLKKDQPLEDIVQNSDELSPESKVAFEAVKEQSKSCCNCHF